MEVGVVIIFVLVVLFAVLGLIFLVVSGVTKAGVSPVPLHLSPTVYGAHAEDVSAPREPPQIHAQSRGTSAHVEDPRTKALPRCPRCGSATAYEDLACPKCGAVLVSR